MIDFKKNKPKYNTKIYATLDSGMTIILNYTEHAERIMSEHIIEWKEYL